MQVSIVNKLEVEVKSRSLADLPSDRDVQRTIRYALQSAKTGGNTS